ncbi:hypothetical protein NDU88_005237 [Pleurodeles waltl]|uniref:Uncharacterized protein n=1 Tax=Pleurodeles waltl TaxID=8319 RepID=A0AAV7UIB2_PLEWA|nr:hypothetical protein NDU88_005237 [Pleurodeles waltl]
MVQGHKRTYYVGGKASLGPPRVEERFQAATCVGMGWLPPNYLVLGNAAKLLGERTPTLPVTVEDLARFPSHEPEKRHTAAHLLRGTLTPVL